MRTPTRAARSFFFLADSARSTGYEFKLLDKNISVDDDMTPINYPDHDSISEFSKKKKTREGTGLFCVPTVCEPTSVSNVSCGDVALPK